MSKTESENWRINREVQHPSNYPDDSKYCIDLIVAIAVKRGCNIIEDSHGEVVASW